MTDIERIVWGALGGVAVYVVGQVLSKFFIEPLYEFRKTLGEVRFNLAFHAAAIHTPTGRTSDTSNAAAEALMKNSCDLIAKLQAVPLYGLTRLISFGALPSRKAIEQASVQLRVLSTYTHETGDKANASIEAINKYITSIVRLLRLSPMD